MERKSLELPGLKVLLDKLLYHTDDHLPPETPHAFLYFLTIANLSDRRVILLGRKWILTHADGSTQVIEGDKIIGQTPDLRPNEKFSYNSYHVSATTTVAHGAFHGIDEFGNPIHVKIPPFTMTPPSPHATS